MLARLVRRITHGPTRRRAGAAAVIAVIALLTASCRDIYGVGDRDLEILWPRSGTTLVDEELFEVRLRGWRLDDYEVYWYVDDSRERRMWNDYHARPQVKAYLVDTWFWTWNGRGPYTVGFIAEDHRGRQIAHRTIRVYVR